MQRRKKYVIILSVICLVLIAIGAYFSSNRIVYPFCNYDSLEKQYFDKNKECSIAAVSCLQGSEAFKDSCGCGCKSLNNSLDNLDKVYCTEESRNTQVCVALYDPVCGWFDQSIKCIKYPCAQTYSNSCQACQNSKVEFYTPGNCPE